MRRMKLFSKPAIRKVSAAFLCLGLLAPCLGCSSQNTVNEEVPSLIEPLGVSIQTIKIEKKDVEKATYETGKVIPKTINLAFEIDGTVSEICVERGQFVTVGTVLAKLDEEKLLEELEDMEENIAKVQENYQDQIDSYEERLANIQKEIKDLKSKISSSSGDQRNKYKAQRELKNIEIERVQVEYDKMKKTMDAKIEKLQEEYEEKKELLGQNQLVAQEEGVVSSNIYDLLGQKVKAEQNVVTLIDDRHLYIKGNYMAENYFNKLTECYALVNGQKIPITYVELTDEELKRVTATATPGASTDRTIRYELSPTEGQQVSAGDYAIKVSVTERKENVVVLPQGVVQKDKLGYYVYLMKDGSRSRVEVILGTSDNSYVEVLSGLQEGDEIYVQY